MTWGKRLEFHYRKAPRPMKASRTRRLEKNRSCARSRGVRVKGHTHMLCPEMRGLAGTGILWWLMQGKTEVLSNHRKQSRRPPTCSREGSYLFDIPDQVVQCVWGPMSLKTIKKNHMVLLVGLSLARQEGSGRKGLAGEGQSLRWTLL